MDSMYRCDVLIPAGVRIGAVVELYYDHEGKLAAEVRINGPKLADA